jgi:hypothetical protein
LELFFEPGRDVRPERQAGKKLKNGEEGESSQIKGKKG